MSDWTHRAIERIEADFCRSADTHLIALPLPAWSARGIDFYLKDESTHPTGSLKHRLARSLFLYALCNGWLREGTTVVEASSGSTAVSEAYFARLLGLPFVAVMPRSTSAEKIALIRFYGGDCHLVDHASEVYAAAQALAEFLSRAPGRASQVRVQLNPLCSEAGRMEEQAAAQGWRVLPRETHLLDLRPGLEALRRGYHATKRNQIAKPVKVDSRIALARTEADLQPYFEVYAHSLQRWGRAGVWPYPRQLFLDLLQSPVARIWTHQVQGRLACAVVILECRHQALYWQGVSHIEPDQKPAHPMVRLMDAVIQDLCARGVPVLNLGASEGLPQVRRFKEEFGARPAGYSTLQWESAAWRWLQRLRG